MFHNGTNIPFEFHVEFIEANNGDEIEIGEKRKLVLIVNDIEYEATLIQLNMISSKRSALHIRYSGNKEYRELLTQVFHHSYSYLQNARAGSNEIGKRQFFRLPDGQAEYIEFYSTGVPYRYIVSFIPFGYKGKLK